MNEPTIENLFARYADFGDVDALGDVFDRTAPTLLRVAVHIVGRSDDADDLLQSTFLTALEKRGRWDRARPLLPWLIGILEKHGHEFRRSRAAVGAVGNDGVALEVREQESPDVAVVFQETTEVFARALQEVPDTYRSALLAYFRDGRKAVEIAAETGVAPGTVRMRVHRGLELLKRALPAGAAVSVALFSGSARGLAAVRAEVLRRGVELAPAGTFGGATLFAWSGSLVMKSVGIFALLLLVFAAWRWSSEGDRTDTARLGVAAEGTQDSMRASNFADALDPPARREIDRARAATDSVLPADLDELEARARIGFSGRLLDASRNPLADVDVRLAEIEPTRFRPARDAAFEPIRELAPLVDRARTDAQGRFRLDGARRGRLQALFVDPAGPRGALRILDRSPTPGSVVDVGDVVLDAGRRLHGRVARRDGRRLAGARIVAIPRSIWPGPAEMLERVLRQNPLTADAFAVLQHSSTRIDPVPMSDELRGLLRELPFATVMADAEGSFEIDSPSGAEVWLLVDAAESERCGASVLSVAATSDDVGTITLDAAQALTGRVVDAEGASVAGARVFAAGGAALQVEHESMVLLQGGARTDAEGRFAIDGLSALAPLVIAVQRSGSAGWELVRASAREGAVDVVLGSGSTWRVRVVDMSGSPVPAAVLEITTNAAGSGVLLGAELALVSRTCDADGVARLESWPPGDYSVRASAPGIGTVTVRESLGVDDQETRVILHPEHELVVTVVDAATDTPVRNARVRLSDADGSPAAAGTSDTSGTARLRHGTSERQRFLTASHPAFASRLIDVPFGAERVVVALDAGGTIEARVRKLEAPAQATLVFMNSRDGTHFFARADEKGLARVTHVSAGEWTFRVRSSLEHVEQFFVDRFDSIESGQCEVRAGKTTQLVVQVLGGHEPPPGADADLSGTIHVNGAPGSGLRVTARAKTGTGWSSVGTPGTGVTTDADGRFAIASCPSGTVALDIETADVEQLLRVHTSRVIELRAGENPRVAIELRTATVRLKVLDPDGKPVPFAQAGFAQETTEHALLSNEGTSDAEGLVTLLATEEGRFRVAASHPELGLASGEIDIRFGAALDPIEIRLSAGVPCKGVARLAGFVPTEQTTRDEAGVGRVRGLRGYLSISKKGDPQSLQYLAVDFVDGRAPFDIRGFTPGDYLGACISGTSVSKPFEFSLGAGGDAALELRLDAMD